MTLASIIHLKSAYWF